MTARPPISSNAKHRNRERPVLRVFHQDPCLVLGHRTGFMNEAIWGSSVRASDRPSIQSRVRLTDSPSNLTETQIKYCVDCSDIHSIHIHYASGGRWPPPQKKWHAFGRGTSFVVSIVVAMNRVDVATDNKNCVASQ